MTLHTKALSTRIGTVCAAISEMIRTQQFILDESDIISLESRNNEVLCGWTFAYRVSRESGLAKIEMIKTGLNSLNPRIREHACDIIGEQSIRELREELSKLFVDSDNYVAQAARYNFNEVFEDENDKLI